MDFNQLSKLGLTQGEIKVYSALLELGESTKTHIAQKSGISPSNIYDITNRLIEKGIISKVKKNGIAHFSPANPSHILDFLEDKKSEIEKEKNFAIQILPSLQMAFNEKKAKSGVEVFNGWNGMKTIFEDMISECNAKDECYVFGASRGENDTQADLFFVKYSKLREKKGIVTSIIFNQELQNRKERLDFFKNSKLCKVRFFQQLTPAEIMLYKDKVCILILTKEPVAIRISGNEVSQSFKQYFDVMWSIAK